MGGHSHIFLEVLSINKRYLGNRNAQRNCRGRLPMSRRAESCARAFTADDKKQCPIQSRDDGRQQCVHSHVFIAGLLSSNDALTK
jgi:hypothetical protein